mgnify:FL=1|jgi:hypothetical protein
MKVEINLKIYKKFQRLEDTEDLNEIETLEYFQEILEDLMDDYILEHLNKESNNYRIEEDDNNEQE